MGVRFQRCASSVANLRPGQFFVDVMRHEPGQSCTVYVCCRECGGIEALSDRHVVQAGGRVVPGWKCPTATCSFFEFITLETYGEPA